ncbi:MAG TPA: hypothetical protein VNS11_06635, partial [Sphingomicrobium sp.]|nr:hypothetical protein [Sphingomicrobium sp.]
VYDRDRHPHRWSDAMRNYWQQRRQEYVRTNKNATAAVTTEQWGAFRNRNRAMPVRVRGGGDDNSNAQRVRVQRQRVVQSVTDDGDSTVQNERRRGGGRWRVKHD